MVKVDRATLAEGLRREARAKKPTPPPSPQVQTVAPPPASTPTTPRDPATGQLQLLVEEESIEEPQPEALPEQKLRVKSNE